MLISTTNEKKVILEQIQEGEVKMSFVGVSMLEALLMLSVCFTNILSNMVNHEKMLIQVDREKQNAN